MSITTDYDVVIGLEVHVQLSSPTKIFCSCPTEFGAAPNSQVCPVCAGLPGSLPVLSRHVFEAGIKAVLALGGRVSDRVKFDRKNYFYPDLPKGYQISQFDNPLGVGGEVEVTTDEGTRSINLTRLHLEEDAGKLIHENTGGQTSLVDLNRAGVPLAEIVSEPEIKTPDEAYSYLNNLKAIVKAVGASNADMEKGQLRCDANVSLRKSDSDPLGTKVEIKNLNSFKNVRAALNYEIKRQTKMLDEGETIVQETRLYDVEKDVTRSMRGKEEAHDYRYFPDPDLVPFQVDAGFVQSVKENLPELPKERLARLADAYKLNPYDLGILMQTDGLADSFERLAGLCKDYKTLVNWLIGPVLAKLNEDGLAIEEMPISDESLIELIDLVAQGKISFKVAKEDVFPECWQSGQKPSSVVEAKGLVQISDASELEGILDSVVGANEKSVTDYKAGKKNALMFLVGQVMKQTKGKANPNLVKELLEKKLD